MADSTAIPIIMHPGGVKYADQKHWGQAPVGADVGASDPSLVRDPLVGSYIALCALPGMFNASGAPKFGHISLLKKGATNTRANKIRLITTDAPDGA